MNAINTTPQISILLIGSLELLAAILAWLFDWRARSNRYLGGLLGLLALNSFAASRLARATGMAQAESWLPVLAATTLAFGPALFLVVLSLLRPKGWSPTPWERRLWRLAHLLIAAPVVLILGDLLLNSRWLYTGLDTATYRGGFVSSSSYTKGALALPLRVLNQYILIPAALLPAIQALWRGSAAAPAIRRRARWLLTTHLTVLLIASGLQFWLDSLWTIRLVGLFLALTYTTMLMRGMLSDDALRRILANLSLRPKLYIGLGASLMGLLALGGISIYSSVANQQLLRRTLTRQSQLSDLASDINENMLAIQNGAFVFYDTWSLTGFEGASLPGGFERANEIYLTPLRERIERVRSDIAAIQALNPDADTRTTLGKISSNLDAYETSLLAMSDQMEKLGFDTSGELGRMQETMAELQSHVQETGMGPLQTLLLKIKQYEDDFFLRSDLAAVRVTRELVQQAQEQIAATPDAQLSEETKAQLTDLFSQYDDHFLSAVSESSKLRDSRTNIISQSDLTSVLTDQLFERQQTAFSDTTQQLQEQQSNAITIVLGLALLTLLASTTIAYYVAGQIIRPVQAMGETANRLAAGELAVRADIRGQDEIGTTAAALNLMAERLQNLLSGLEQQVAERTRDLERRSAHLEASAEVAHAAASILEADRLLRQVVELIRERFELYYVGLFRVDENREWALLQAGTGEAGRAMLARGHRIKVGEGMIGWSIAHAQARIASRAEADAVRLATAELPDTRSEAALPLRSRGRVLGALTVQSDQPNAFDPDILTVLQAMADQVAVALDNARLFAESEAAVEAQRRAFGEISHKAWGQLLRAQPGTGFRKSRQGLSRTSDEEKVVQLLQKSQAAETTDSEVALPIKVQDRTIGVINARKPQDGPGWTAEEMTLLQSILDQLEVALESARLHQETQTRAHRERLAREITDKVRAAPDVESIAQIATEELIKALGGVRAFVKLRPQTTGDNGDSDGV